MTRISRDKFVRMQGDIIHQWQTKKSHEVMVLNTWKFSGHRFFDCRIWYRRQDDNYYMGKGIRLRRDDLDKFFRTVRKLRKFVEDT